MANVLIQPSFPPAPEHHSDHRSWLKYETPSRNLWEGASGISQGDAIMVSDNESEEGNLEDDEGDTFPPAHELGQPARRNDKRFGTEDDAIMISDAESEEGDLEDDDSVIFPPAHELGQPARRNDKRFGTEDDAIMISDNESEEGDESAPPLLDQHLPHAEPGSAISANRPIAINIDDESVYGEFDERSVISFSSLDETEPPMSPQPELPMSPQPTPEHPTSAHTSIDFHRLGSASSSSSSVGSPQPHLSRAVRHSLGLQGATDQEGTVGQDSSLRSSPSPSILSRSEHQPNPSNMESPRPASPDRIIPASTEVYGRSREPGHPRFRQIDAARAQLKFNRPGYGRAKLLPISAGIESPQPTSTGQPIPDGIELHQPTPDRSLMHPAYEESIHSQELSTTSFTINPNDEAMSNHQDSPEEHRDCCQRQDTESEGIHYHVNTEQEHNEGDDNNTRQSQRKRRKPNPAAPATISSNETNSDLRRSQRKRRKPNPTPATINSNDTNSDLRRSQRKRHKPNPAVPATLSSNGNTSIPVRRSTRGQKRPEPSSPYIYSREDRVADASLAEFGEWPLESAVLKRVIVGNQATFQIQFTWDCCVERSKDEAAIAPIRLGQARSLPVQSDSIKTTNKKRKTPYRRTGKRSRAQSLGYVSKTDDQGKSYDAWRFTSILDSRQCSHAPDEIEYKVKWTSPWPATWEPALNLRDNAEELMEFHRRMPDRPGPPDWAMEAVTKE